MSNYFLTYISSQNKGTFERLRQLIELKPLTSWHIPEEITPGNIYLIDGVSLLVCPEKSRVELVESILSQSSHLIILPPFLMQGKVQLLPGLESPGFQQAAFGPITIHDEMLHDYCGLQEMTILFTFSLMDYRGLPLATDPSGKAVAIHYQHRSNWGQLVWTTLMLTSASARSIRAHRVAFLQGLIQWLGLHTPPPFIPPRNAKETSYMLNQQLPLVLLALGLLTLKNITTMQDIEQAVQKIREKLVINQKAFDLHEICYYLETNGVLTRIGENAWQILSAKLSEQVNRHHLSSYMRRIR